MSSDRSLVGIAMGIAMGSASDLDTRRAIQAHQAAMADASRPTDNDLRNGATPC